MVHNVLPVQAGHIRLVAPDHRNQDIFPPVIGRSVIAGIHGIPQNRGIFLHKGEVQARAVFRALQQCCLVISGQVDSLSGIILHPVQRDLIEGNPPVDNRVGISRQVHIRNHIRIGNGVIVAFLNADFQALAHRVAQRINVLGLHLLPRHSVLHIVVCAQQVADIPEGDSGCVTVLQRVDQVVRALLGIGRPDQIIGILPVALFIGHYIVVVQDRLLAGGKPCCV